MNICEETFAPLEVAYDYDEIKRQVSREIISNGPNSIWRYRAFLPVEGKNVIDVGTGMTPLVKSHRLARRLGLKNLYIKNDEEVKIRKMEDDVWQVKDIFDKYGMAEGDLIVGILEEKII
jgi:hypothetical protein